MDKKEKELISKLIHDFDNQKDTSSPIEAENALVAILAPLLKSDGFSFVHNDNKNDEGVDFLAFKDDLKVGIEYKHYKNGRVGTSQVLSLIGAAVINKFDKVILLTSSVFSRHAKMVASEAIPIAVELLDINSLKNWASGIEAEYDESEVVQVLRSFSQKVIELITKYPRTLDEIEWRDLERVIAEIFKGIGFDVTLTPSAKDGGKDVILECVSLGTRSTFIVEVKHWRSGQKVGSKAVKDFIKVIAREKREGGLFLSTYGFAENAVEGLTEIEKQKIKIGQETKIVSLCKTYMRRKSGLWYSDQSLPDILFNETA